MVPPPTTTLLFAKLISILSDLRGLEAIFCMGRTPCIYGCIKCWLRHTCKCNGKGKTAYNNHFRLLPVNHPLRVPLSKLHNGSNPPEEGPCREKDAPSLLRYRSNEEIVQRRFKPGEHPELGRGEQVRPFTGLPDAVAEVTAQEVAEELAADGLRRGQQGALVVAAEEAAAAAAPTNGGGVGDDDDDDSEKGDGEDDDGEAAPRLEADPRTGAWPQQPFMRLRYFNFVHMIVVDAMHTIGGVLKSLCLVFQKLREQKHVVAYEANINGRAFNRSYLAGKVNMQCP